jgi:hypothetical protein
MSVRIFIFMLKIPKAHVLLTDDGELARPVAVEPLPGELSLSEKIGTFVVRVTLAVILLAPGVLLLRTVPGIKLEWFLILYLLSAVSFIILIHGLCVFYDAHWNRYSYDYGQTLKALHWETIGALGKAIASFVLLVIKKLSDLYTDNDYSGHDWDYRRSYW